MSLPARIDQAQEVTTRETSPVHSPSRLHDAAYNFPKHDAAKEVGSAKIGAHGLHQETFDMMQAESRQRNAWSQSRRDSENGTLDFGSGEFQRTERRAGAAHEKPGSKHERGADQQALDHEKSTPRKENNLLSHADSPQNKLSNASAFFEVKGQMQNAFGKLRDLSPSAKAADRTQGINEVTAMARGIHSEELSERGQNFLHKVHELIGSVARSKFGHNGTELGGSSENA